MARRARAGEHPVNGERTSPLERVLQHGALAVVAGTGVALFWMKYLAGAPEDEFSIVGHPWQPATLHLHVLSAPALVLAIGMLLRSHAMVRAADPSFKRSRLSGWALLLTGLPMIASGYAMQVVTAEGWRLGWVVAHVASSVVFVAGSIGHLVAGRGWLRRGASS